MADRSTSPGHATRSVATTRGLLTYAELAPLLAERVLAAEQRIVAGDFAGTPLDGDFLLSLHSAIAGDLVPDWAGRWRTSAVQVGAHEAPPPHEVPILIRLYTDDLASRLAHLEEATFLETLAFAEGRLLSIHPFLDFNGRVTRLWLRELLRRLELPPVDLVPTSTTEEPAYFAALRAGDTPGAVFEINRHSAYALRVRGNPSWAGVAFGGTSRRLASTSSALAEQGFPLTEHRFISKIAPRLEPAGRNLAPAP